MRRVVCLTWIGVLLHFLSLSAPGWAKIIVCIDLKNPHDQAMNKAEGYYRQYLSTRNSIPPDIIQRSGNFKKCLELVADKDTLIINAHGNKGYFRLNGVGYPGFKGGLAAKGTGTEKDSKEKPLGEPLELPANFRPDTVGLKIFAIIRTCFSADSAPPGISVVKSMQAALAAGAPPVVGLNVAIPFGNSVITLAGGTQQMRDKAWGCLERVAVEERKRLKGKCEIPDQPDGKPDLRYWVQCYPPAGGTVMPNVVEVVTRIIANCPGAGGAAVTASITYNGPCEGGPLLASLQPCDLADPEAECDPVFEEIPSLSNWGLIIFSLVLLATLVFFISSKRRLAAPAAFGIFLLAFTIAFYFSSRL